jgi:hypothetical protein
MPSAMTGHGRAAVIESKTAHDRSAVHCAVIVYKEKIALEI